MPRKVVTSSPYILVLVDLSVSVWHRVQDLRFPLSIEIHTDTAIPTRMVTIDRAIIAPVTEGGHGMYAIIPFCVQCVAMYMDSSSTCANCSMLVAHLLIQSICSLVTMWTEDTSVLR